MRPHLLVFSSLEGLAVANAVHEQLEPDAEVTVWNQGLIDPSQSLLDALLSAAESSDCGVFVLSSDDAVRIRGEMSMGPRANVVLELGVFLGKLGRSNCFVLVPGGAAKPVLPSDLSGVVWIPYDTERDDGNMVAAVGPACNKIRRALRRAATSA